MTVIVAIKSSFKDLEAGSHEQIRNTYVQNLIRKASIKFFLGRPTCEIGGLPKSLHPTTQNSYNPKSDEIILDCPDDLGSAVWKTRAICKWFVDKVQSHILILPPASMPWLIEGADYADYIGLFNFEGIEPREVNGPMGEKILIKDCSPWAVGGIGFMLSKKAAMVIAERVPIKSQYIMGSYDDFWVGQVLGIPIQTGDLLRMDLK